MTKRAVFNNEGFMTWISEPYMKAALKRGEICEDEEGVLRVIPQPIRELSPLEKRALVLRKERSKR